MGQFRDATSEKYPLHLVERHFLGAAVTGQNNVAGQQSYATTGGTRDRIGCHTFRATGITAYLEAAGTLENAQAMAAHESPRTTKLYDRTSDEITLSEVERIAI